MCITDEIKAIKEDLRNYHDQNQKMLVTAADSVPPALSPILLSMVSTLADISRNINELKKYNLSQDEKLSKIEVQTTKTNGRVTRIELWKANIKGATTAAKGIWAFISVFIIGSAIGLFHMYQTVDKLHYIIQEEIHAELYKK